MTWFKGTPAQIFNYAFQGFLVIYLLLLLIEQIWAKSISSYLNLNYLLISVIVFGILDVFSEYATKTEKPITKKDYFLIILPGIAGFVIIKFKTASLGWLSWLISIIAGILIILLSILVLQENENDEDKKKGISGKKKSWLKNQLDLLNLRGKIFLGCLGIIIGLAIISLIIHLFSSLSYLDSFRIVFGSVLVLFIPGFIISYIFFPKTREFETKTSENKEEKERRTIDWIERIALSFALSIAIVPLVIFYLNLIGVRINLLNSFLTILGIIIISLGIIASRSEK
jgi:hypothetical protein